ncbi:transmembrane protein, putative (macronuclear) [Tetrahymena thermophila SB210]|uniref:Transmembrane protein, putative n=1 Tax=Tetrahymena thermophila (strain SB210) TaxID=312017 RepID=I7ME98_TETTS|nr:transmembrane protein, putative [Tetrahymena thermophila SB210]EAR95774.2 transmembrane protein, putative [Tetrahymena thermophila SB210]|eukprot:XP_001016019.2 transmembrane protein, putative [Tetrahymena thermophila SB210]
MGYIMQEISTQQQIYFEKQRLHNYVYLNKIISELQYQALSNDMTTLEAIYKKIVNQQLIKSSQYRQKECSVIAQSMNLCPLDINEEQKKNMNWVNLWFHREILKSQDLQDDEKHFFELNKYFQFYTRSIYDYRKDQLFIATWIYNTYNTSLMVAAPGQSYNYTGITFQICQPGKHIVDYDPRCRSWYQQALQQEGQVFIEPYQFSFDGNIGMTISTKIFDDFGNMLSIISIDYDISELITNIFQPQDQQQVGDQEGYTVFFHEKNMTIFYHKNWSRFSKQTFSWPDFEYLQNETYPNMQKDKASFTQQVSDSIKFAHTYNYSIENMTNIDNFFQSFEKDGVKYLIYPIQVTSVVYANKNKKKNQIVMFVARSFVILFIIFCAVMHYAAVLYYQIDIPLRMLQAYFMQELTRQKIIKFGQQTRQKEHNLSKKSEFKKLSEKKGKILESINQKDQGIDLNDQDSLQQQLFNYKDKKFMSDNISKNNNYSGLNNQQNQQIPQSQSQIQSNQNLFFNQQNIFNQQDLVTTAPIQSNKNSNENNPKIKQNVQCLSPLKQTRSIHQSQYYYLSQNPELASQNQRFQQQNGISKYLYSETSQHKGNYNMGSKTDNFSQNIFKLNPSPRRKLTGSKGRMNANRKIQEKIEERSQNQMISRQLRQIAVFSEKDMKQVLNIKLTDIPIMFHEMQIIISTIQEFSEIIQYLEGGYEETQDEWEKLTRLRQALKVFRYVKNFNAQVLVYKEIGNILLDKYEFKQCIEYYQQSLIVSLQHNYIPTIQALFDMFRNRNQCNLQKIDPNYLRSLLPTLYICGFAVSEIGFSLSASIYEKNGNIESLNWLRLSKEYLNTSFNICNLINEENLKKIEIQIFIKLTQSEVNIHLNDLFSAQSEFKAALQLLQTLKHEIDRNKNKNQQIFFSYQQISNYFSLIQGVFLIKQEKYYQACQKFTDYLEFSSIYYFRSKALKYIKDTFDKFNLVSKKINLMYSRFQNNDSYNIFILFQSTQNIVFGNKTNTQQVNSIQTKNRVNSFAKKIIKQNLNELAWIQQYQEAIFQYLKEHFLQRADKIFLAGYDQEFKVLQHLFPFENNSYQLRSQKILRDFLNGNNELQSKFNKKIYGQQQSLNYNNISMSNNQQFNTNQQEIDNNRRKERLTSQGTLFSRKDSNQITFSEDYETIFQQIGKPQISWEEAFFNLIKEVIQQYNEKQLLKENNLQQNKKIMLVTFCFYSTQSPIPDQNLFQEKLKFVTKMMPQHPKILNFFLPLAREQSNIAAYKSQIIENHRDEIDQSSSNQKNTQSFQLSQLTNDLTTINGESLNFIPPMHNNETKFFPKNGDINHNHDKEVIGNKQIINFMNDNQIIDLSKNQLNSFTRDCLNNSKGDSNANYLQKEELQNYTDENTELFNISQSSDSLNNRNNLQDLKKEKILLEKNITKSNKNKESSNQFSNFFYQERDSQQQKPKDLSDIKINQEQKQPEKENKITQENPFPSLINIDFQKFYIFSNQSQMFYYLSKLRHKKIDFHKVFDALFK